MDRPVEEAGPLQFVVESASMYGSKVVIPSLGSREEEWQTVEGPMNCEVVLRPIVKSRAEFLRWQQLVGAGRLEVQRAG